MEHINLNMVPNGVPSVCHVSQFDNSDRKIRFHLLNGSDPYTLSGTETIKLRIRKQNNEVGLFDIANTSSDYIDLIVLQPMSDVAGDSECEFQILDTGSRIGSFNFKMKVEPDAFDGQLATGSIAETPVATFQTDLAEDLIRADVILEPIQDLHGYDHPWPAGGGVNKWDEEYRLGFYNTSGVFVANSSGYMSSKNAIPILPETEYAIVIGGANNQTIYVCYYDSNNGFISRISTSLSSGVKKVTSPSNAYYMQFSTEAFYGTTYNNNIAINYPSSVTTYSPYSNICPISGHDEATLMRVGINLFGGLPLAEKLHEYGYGDYPIDTVNKTIQYRRGKPLVPGNYENILFSECKPNTVYTLLFAYTCPGSTKNESIVVHYTDGTYAKLSMNANVSQKSVSVLTTNPSKSVKDITTQYFADGLATIYYNECGIFEGAITADDFKPYTPAPTPITVKFGQTVYQGKLYSENRYIEVTHALATLDGNTSESDLGITVQTGYTQVSWVPYITTGKGTEVFKSNIFKDILASGERLYSIWNNRNVTTPVPRMFMGLPNTVTTKAEAVAWFANNPTQVVYELAEPFIIDLSQQYSVSIPSTPIASFETTVDEPLEKLECEFSATQDLHGYDKPWPAGGNKNILPDLVDGTYVQDGITIVVSKGLITITGQKTVETSLTIAIPLVNSFTLKQNYYWHFRNTGGSSSITMTFVGSGAAPAISGTNRIVQYTGSDATVTSTNIYFAAAMTSSVNFSLKPSIEATGDVTDWTPYSNICPIAGVTEINTVRCGKNLWDEQWEEGRLTSGVPAPSSNQIRSKNFCPLKPNTTYYLYSSKTDGGANNKYYVLVVFYDKSKSYISEIWTNRLAFTSPSNAYYFKISTNSGTVVYGNTYNNDISINYPSTDTNYHAYNGTSVIIPFGDTYYGGVLDVISGELKLTYGIVDLGTLSYSTRNVNGVNRITSGVIPNIYAEYSDDYDYSKFGFLSSIYDIVSVNNIGLNDCAVAIGYKNFSYGNRFIINDSRITDPTTAPTILSGQTMVYKLATPIEIDLTPTEVDALIGQNNVFCDTGNVAVDYKNCPAPLPIRIPALVGTNNVFSDAGDVEVEYYKSTRIGGDD